MFRKTCLVSNDKKLNFTIFYSICFLRKMSRRRDNYLHQCQRKCVHLSKIEHQSERGYQGSANQNLFPNVRARANKKSLPKVLERTNEKRIHMFLTPALTLYVTWGPINCFADEVSGCFVPIRLPQYKTKMFKSIKVVRKAK